RVVGGDGLAQVLEQRRLARLGRGDDEPPLPAPDGRDEVDDAQRGLRLLRRQPEGLVRVDGDQVLEVGQRAVVLRRKATGLLDLDQDAAPTSGVTGEPLDLRTVAQAEVPANRSRNDRIVAKR